MPRNAKVHAVPVEQGEESQQEGLVVAVSTQGVEDQRGGVEVKTEAEQLTDVINEVKADAEEVVETVVEPVVEPVEAKPKAKPKAKAKAKPEPPPEVTPPPIVEAAPARVVLTQGHADSLAQVSDASKSQRDEAKAACPDCGKQMSAKTLKYSHKCTTVKATPVATSRIVEIVEDEVTKHLTNRRAERMAHREAVVEKLMQSAF